MQGYTISKQAVYAAWLRVKANGGAAGADNVSIDMLESNLGNELYKLWNRMNSGSYMVPPVKRVETAKSDGKMRPLGIPTVADRIAQMAVARHFIVVRFPKLSIIRFGNFTTVLPLFDRTIISVSQSLIILSAKAHRSYDNFVSG